MTTAITWRLIHDMEAKYVRFILIDYYLFRLLSSEGVQITPLGDAYVSPEDAHRDAVAMTADLELEGFRMDIAGMRVGEVNADSSVLLALIRTNRDEARQYLVGVLTALLMYGEVLA